MQNLVVFRHGHTENDSRDILETMDPLFSLGTLAANVKQSEKKGKHINRVTSFQTDKKFKKPGVITLQGSSTHCYKNLGI